MNHWKSRSSARASFFPFEALLQWSLLVLAAILLFSGCSRNASGQPKAGEAPKRPPVPVTVGKAVEKSVPVQVRAIGKAQAYATVSVKAQIGGELTAVHFKEGQKVKKGDPLFTIDPRPFEAELRQAEANLAKEKVQLQNAQRQAGRYASVVQKGYVSQEQFDQIASNRAVLEASIRANEAAVENVKLQLAYSAIRSPIDGIAGELKIHRGNLVRANDNETPLVTINQVDPIYVTFSVPEVNLPEVKRHMASGRLKVEAAIPGHEDRPAEGELTFIDNAVDPATGTIQLKGVFVNKEGILWPGQFLNVSLTLTTRHGVVVVPAQAVQTGQQGQYVFVVKPDSKVEYRLVKTGITMNGDWVIEQGVAPGETVVTDGQLRLANDSQVRVIENGGGRSEGAAQ